jgi:AcrR family transcriptional regulator
MKLKDVIDRKEQIYGEASKLFSQKGFQATSMRELADKVGIEAASIYSHYPSKDNLLYAIAWRCADDFFKSVTPIYEGNLNTKAKLKAMTIAHIEVIVRNLDAAEVFNNEWKHLNEPARSEYAQMRDKYGRMFDSVVYQGIREGLYRDVDSKFITLTILASLNWTAQWYDPKGPMSPKEVGEVLSDILLNGLIRNF